MVGKEFFSARDIRPALKSVGVTLRQLQYLVEKGHVDPAVRTSTLTLYSRDDLFRAYLLLVAMKDIKIEARSEIADGIVNEEEWGPVELNQAVSILLDDTCVLAGFDSFFREASRET
jgi:DNA-binding transcriptional MerR regulator